MNGQQLKNSILQMAVQGKLVPQDPNDEPASVLIQRIREEKEKLIKEKKIKKEKTPSYIFRGSDNLHYEKVGDNDPMCIVDQVPFEIPDSWEWVRLGSVCEIARGGSPRPIKQYLTESPDGINWIKIGDTDKDSKYINSTKEKIIVEGVTKSRLVHKGDFLLTNSMSFGRPYILNIDGCIHDGWLMLSNYQTVYDKDFLYYMLSSRFAYYQFCGVVSGAVVKNLNTDKVEISLMPVPPISEQKRIVTKIEELLPHINEYEKCEAAIIALNKMFPEQLKKSILQEAVQGKLVPQDPSDEPACALLVRIREEKVRIREEKARLIKEGKIKKDKNKSVIFRRDNSYYEKSNGVERCIDEEIPFEIPNNWIWARIGNLFSLQAGKNITASEIKNSLFDGAFPCYGGNDLRGYVDRYNKEGDFPIIGRQGALCGNIKRATGKFYATEHAVCVSTYMGTDVEWSCLFLEALNLNQYATATAQPGLAVSKINEVMIPVPPLKEQKRICQKYRICLKTIRELL